MNNLEQETQTLCTMAINRVVNNWEITTKTTRTMNGAACISFMLNEQAIMMVDVTYEGIDLSSTIANGNGKFYNSTAVLERSPNVFRTLTNRLRAAYERTI